MFRIWCGIVVLFARAGQQFVSVEKKKEKNAVLKAKLRIHIFQQRRSGKPAF
jgi:hypothetical protein